MGPAGETPTSFGQKVETAAGLAYLKCLKPGNEEGTAAGCVKWFGGKGSARLLRHDSNAMLLEWIDGPPLSDLVRDGRDQEAAAILADVVGKLHSTRQAPFPDAQSLRRRMDPLFAGRASAGALSGQARTLARQLLDTTGEERPLHGDIHHDNILHHPERGWLAIDPKGLFGDPHYDLANALCNPAQFPEIVRDGDRVDSQARILAGRLGMDADRLLSFAFCHACLAAIWCREDGADPRHWQEMARIIGDLRMRRR